MQLIPTTPAPVTPAPTAEVRTKTAKPCTHMRLIDEVRTGNGAKTGQLICLECLAEFPDPTYQAPGT